MSERKPAPGRVVVSHSLAPYAESRVCPWYAAGAAVGLLHDALREHLRTEHADQWEACWYCRGRGKVGGPYWMPPPGLIQCRLCHGRGYIETERSKA